MDGRGSPAAGAPGPAPNELQACQAKFATRAGSPPLQPQQWRRRKALSDSEHTIDSGRSSTTDLTTGPYATPPPPPPLSVSVIELHDECSTEGDGGVSGATAGGASPRCSQASLARSISSYRLGHKKLLAVRRRRAADACLALAGLGIALMVAETECIMGSRYSKDDSPSYIVKSLISASTCALLAATVYYHVLDLQLYTLNNCLQDWRVVISGRRIGHVLLELVVCAIHPPPGTGYTLMPVFDSSSHQWRHATQPVDLFLSLPMFGRLYLVVRCLLLHSTLFNDTSFRTIGALNRIRFDARFIVKTLMSLYPGWTLMAVLVTTWLVVAWMIRYCEFYENDIFGDYFTSLYMIVITFLTVGYGDVAPITYCGRILAMATGLVGTGCVALLVTVVAGRLDLTRSERLVHRFMINCDLTKRLKDAAANVLGQTWRVYKYTKLAKSGGADAGGLWRHKRKFVAAIRALRKVKAEQRKASDEAAKLMDVNVIQPCLFENVWDLKQRQEKLQDMLNNVDVSLRSLELQIKALHQRSFSNG